MAADAFSPGLELSRQLAATITPALRAMFPNMPLALACMGPGSDVLGYDTVRSMDHDWGPRLTLIVPDDVRDIAAARIDADIDQLLPPLISGFPTRFSEHADGTTFPDPAGSTHRLHITSTRRILCEGLMIDMIDHLSEAVWLSTPMQSLLEITAGEVFLDDAGELTALRSALAFYPEAVVRYQLAALWMRVSQIQPFIGRTAEVGDEVGSASIVASIVRDLMRIGLLQSGQYVPYAKWLGTAFGRTDIGTTLGPDLEAALQATGWPEREAAVNRAGLQLVHQLNGLALIASVSANVHQFHSRPFHVLPAEQIALSLNASLRDTPLESLPPFVGGSDVITDSTDALKSMEFRMAVRAIHTQAAVEPPV